MGRLRLVVDGTRLHKFGFCVVACFFLLLGKHHAPLFGAFFVGESARSPASGGLDFRGRAIVDAVVSHLVRTEGLAIPMPGVTGMTPIGVDRAVPGTDTPVSRTRRKRKRKKR